VTGQNGDRKKCKKSKRRQEVNPPLILLITSYLLVFHLGLAFTVLLSNGSSHVSVYTLLNGFLFSFNFIYFLVYDDTINATQKAIELHT